LLPLCSLRLRRLRRTRVKPVTVTTGKVVAIGSAVLTSLSFLNAFSENVGIEPAPLSVENSIVLSGVIVSAMLPFLFATLAMLSVGKAAMVMVKRYSSSSRRPNATATLPLNLLPWRISRLSISKCEGMLESVQSGKLKVRSKPRDGVG
jgi:hypothetical protein